MNKAWIVAAAAVLVSCNASLAGPHAVAHGAATRVRGADENRDHRFVAEPFRGSSTRHFERNGAWRRDGDRHHPCFNDAYFWGWDTDFSYWALPYRATLSPAPVQRIAPPPIVVHTPAVSPGTDLVKVSIPNADGTRTDIPLLRANGRFIGPAGEEYATLPTSATLALRYRR